jgi:lipopolysaccharide transport system permease protein
MIKILLYVQSIFRNFLRYIPLMQHLVARDVKLKYRGSFLGYIWSVLNPLLIMLVLTVVFSQMFHNNIANYPVYLFSGRMLFTFMTDSTSSAMLSILGSSGLLKKTYVPKYIFPLANITSAAVNLLFSLGAFFFLILMTGAPLSYHIVMFPLVLIQLYVFCLGLGLFLAQAAVFFRDMEHLYSVFTTAWMYLTPLFYPMESLPDTMRWCIAAFNPMYCYVQQTRLMFIDHAFPSALLFWRGWIEAVLMLIIGLWSFYKTQDKFILHL